jgi:L-lactate dehydrogenase
VGTTTAYALLMSDLAAEIVLVDIDVARAEGEVRDLNHAAHFAQARVRGGYGYGDCAGAAAVIITAGVNQKPGQTRIDLLRTNHALFEAIVPQIAAHAPDTVIVVATNPVDVLTHSAARLSGFPIERVIGTGTTLDSNRFRHELGRVYKVSPKNVHALIVGEHGDSQLPVWSLATISGMRLRDYCSQAGVEYDQAAMDECARRTRQAAYEIIQRKGKTNYGVASVLVKIVEAIVTDSDAIMTLSRVGEYEGVEDIALSMPCKVNREGAHQEVPLLLNQEEREALRKSALTIKEAIAGLD